MKWKRRTGRNANTGQINQIYPTQAAFGNEDRFFIAGSEGNALAEIGGWRAWLKSASAVGAKSL
jgi:hypothetical protein